MKRPIGESQVESSQPAKRYKRTFKKRKAAYSSLTAARRQAAAQSRLKLRIPAPLNPFPAVWKTVLTYPVTTGILAPGASSGVAVFRLNSLYAFDYGANFGNVQPLDLD